MSYPQDNRGRGRGRGRGGGGPGGYQGERGPSGSQYDNRGRGRGRGGGPGGYQGERGPTGYDNRGQGGSGGFNRGGGQRGGGGQGNFRGAPGSADLNVPMSEATEHKQIVRQKLSPGTQGRAVKLLANFYQFMISEVTVYHYDVNISVSKKKTKNSDDKPSEPSTSGVDNSKPDKSELFIKKFSSEIFSAFKQNHPEIFANVHSVYDDYKNLYSVEKQLILAQQEYTQKVNINGKEEFFRIKLRLTEEVDLSPASVYYKNREVSSQVKGRNIITKLDERVISVLEILFRSLFTQAGYVSHQRKYFDLSKSDKSGLRFKIHDFVKGCVNSVRMTEFGLAMNLHLKTTCIISKSYAKLDQVVSDLAEVGPQELANGPLRMKQLSNVNKMLRHVDIFTNHAGTKMTFKVNFILNQTPRQRKFDKDGKLVTTHEYFKERYNIDLKNFPMVQTTKAKIVLPLELCFLKDKQFLSNSKIDLDMQAELLKVSTQPPNVYFNRTNEIVKRIGDIDANQRKALGFDSLCLKPVAITGRVLPSPIMKSAGMNEKFFRPLPPMIWAFYCFDDFVKPDSMNNFIKEMRNVANNYGLNLPEPRIVKIERVTMLDDVQRVCQQIVKAPELKNLKLDLFVCGFPKKHNSIFPTEDIYNMVKHYFDQKFGIMSQGVKSDNIIRTPRGYFNNFLLKVNGKFGGQNTVIDSSVLASVKKLPPSKTMVVGVDVYHPGLTDQVRSSIAAAIGSYDSMLTKYSASIRAQAKDDKDKDREMIKQIEGMFVELLLEYKKQNNQSLPENVFVFRDGVSEGQLDKLRTIEIPLIEKAMVKVIGKKVNLTLLVVQKRHHTRFSQTEADMKGKYNVTRGTVVDQFIVDPEHEEFYLASHDSPMGTSKPSKYIKIRDDLKLSTDDLQKFCFFACHQCIRTRNSISIPTSIRYADLCAYRSSLHIRAQHHDETKTGSDEAWEQRVIEKLNQEIKVNDQIKIKIYYG